LRLHKHITRAAAFWHHVEFVLSAINGHSAERRSRHSDDRSTPVTAVPRAATFVSCSAEVDGEAAFHERPLSSESGPLTEPRQTPNRRPFLDI
jgi:hypothetical protein